MAMVVAISVLCTFCVSVFVAMAVISYKVCKQRQHKDASSFPCTVAATPYWTVPNPFTWSKRHPAPSNVQISQSTPDLHHGEEVPGSPGLFHQEEQIGRAHYKTVIKQSTMPTMSNRHLTFQRQLSHKLDLSNVEFSIHSVKYKEQPDAGRMLKPELYRQDAQELRSSQVQTAHADKPCGRLHFSIRFCHVTECLVVRVLKAEELPAKDFSGTSDPYVKLYLLPDRKNKFQTKVHRKTLNPDFNEHFRFPVPFNALEERVLQFSIYDFDRFSRHDLIGVVLVRDITAGDTQLSQEATFCRDIAGVQREEVELGELMMSLCYLPTAGRLTITMIKARNLKAMDLNGTSDPYIKVSLMCHNKRIKKKKTSVKKSTLSPVYNEVIVFDVPQENIEDVSLVIKVIDYDRLGSNELMGCSVVGPDYVGRDHWYEMLSNPRRPIAHWYALMENLPVALQGRSDHRASVAHPGTSD
ncbi:synaptotagmin 9 [Capitella teleta]|uniref:Synaptotagmin 9 n=1 Tax=Capitella teleta TaxID=283909 RepID=R7UL18_CAPTE|nr:synaptotagmin 9 [Capitella teleta]|eukprot:ELU04478.1 synaptotagmin 9 [Capitella teleta]